MSAEPIGYGEFVCLVIEALEAAGVEYLIGGAVAAWAWGEPRSTLDLDLVVDIPLEAVVPLSTELEKRDMLVPPDIILENLLEARADLPINAIHMRSGFKADLYPLRPGDELRQSALKRRVQVDLGPPIGQVFIHSPEDLIIDKTRYFSLSGQTKHLRDISAVLAALKDQLDIVYVETWMERQGLRNIWKELLDTIQHDE
jgi:hypothetical protein